MFIKDLPNKEQKLFESLKRLQEDYNLTKKDFSPIWNPFILFGEDNNRYGIGCPSIVFMRTKEYKEKMSAIIKEQFKNGRKVHNIGKPAHPSQKKGSSEKNSFIYTIKRKNKSDITIKNLRQWCTKNNYIYEALLNGMRLRNYYKDIINIVKHPKP